MSARSRNLYPSLAMFDLLLGDNLQGRKEHIANEGYKFLDLADIS